MITKNQWLKISLVIYFFLTLGLIVAIVCNFLYIGSAPTQNCLSVNDCPECPILPCDELVKTECPAANKTMSGLGLPNEGFTFYLLGSVSKKPSGPTDIGSFETVISSQGTQTVNGIWYYNMETLSEPSAVVWRYSSQYLNFTQNLGTLRIGQDPILGTSDLFTVFLSGTNYGTAVVLQGTIDYVGNHIVFNVGTGPTKYYLYLADADTEIPSLNLPSGLYPVWSNVDATTIPSADPDFAKYVWTLYQTQ